MALIQCDFKSRVLELSTSMNVILPENDNNSEAEKSSSRTENNKYPVLYLLHGLSDDHTIWSRRTSIERYVEKYNLAVVMPAVHRSFYTDMEYGNEYWSFISREIPEIASKYFPISTRREDNFVAGLSMGGYGAFKMGLRCPDKFSAAASLSGVLDIVSSYEENEESEEEGLEEFKLVYGNIDKVKNSKSDLMYLLKQNVENEIELPDLFQCCGTEDFLYENNQNFKKLAEKLKVNLTYEEGPGDHQWSYWDKKIQRVLEWLPVTKIDAQE
ncbi:MAG: alpha/beta hydrolase [Halanaerobiaceae bacterium]